MRCSFRVIRKSILRHIYRKWQDQDLLFVNLCTFLYIQKYETEEKIVFRILSFSHCKHFLYPEFQYLVLKNFHSNTTLTFLNLRPEIIKCTKIITSILLSTPGTIQSVSQPCKHQMLHCQSSVVQYNEYYGLMTLNFEMEY